MTTTRADRNGDEKAERIDLFLADSHLMFSDSLKLLLASQPDIEVVGEARTGFEACRKIQEIKPDVAVLQLCLPGLNGLQVVELLKPLCPEVKMLILTLQADEIYVRTSLKLQVRGYVLRQSPVAELLLAIRKIGGGGTHYDSSLTVELLPNSPGKSADRPPTAARPVTGQEKRLLQLVAQGFSNKEIARKVHLSVKTVESYKVRFAKKLGLRTRVDIVRYTLQRGWLQEAFGRHFVSLKAG